MHLKATSRRICGSRWFLPAFTIFLGLCLGGAQWKGGDRQTGLTSIAFFVAIAAVFALGGRSETIRMIRGDGRDERWARIDLTATALTGLGARVRDHRLVRVGVGARPRWNAVRAARRDRRRRLSRLAVHAASTFVALRQVGSPPGGALSFAQPTPGAGANSPSALWPMIFWSTAAWPM